MNASPSDLGLYVHVPFCARACDFCAFYQEPPKRGDIERYLNGIERELEGLKLEGRKPSTVFWGGGTPGLLPPEDLIRLGQAVVDVAGQPLEWTVEMAPSTVKPAKLEALKELGVTRISMGIQSFNEELLSALGRLHSRDQVLQAIDRVREAGFTNLNLDLIFALPNQSIRQWEDDLRDVLAAKPEHVSTYCLTFEEDTALWVRLMKGQVKRHTEEEEASFYLRAWEQLAAGGLYQYEISNFSQPGKECLHNINTWRMQEWVGVGPSASSQFAGRRYTNVPDLDRWLSGIDQGTPEQVDVVELDSATLAEDALIFGLRMNEGVDLELLQIRFPDSDWNRIHSYVEELVEEGLAVLLDRRLSLTLQGRLLADQVAVGLME